MEADSHRIKLAKAATRTLCLIPLLLAIATILGWMFDVSALKNPFADQPPVAPSTAVCFLLCVGALDCIAKNGDRRLKQMASALAGSALLIALCVLVHYFVHSFFDLDQIFSATNLSTEKGFSPGRMAPNTAICFVLLSGGILFALRQRTAKIVAQVLATTLALVSGVSSLGYMYGEPKLYGLGVFTPMAFPTALALLCAACALFAVQPSFGLMRLVTSSGEAGYMTRRLLPVAMILPVVLGYFRVIGEKTNLYSPAMGVAIMVFAMIVLLCTVIYRTALFMEHVGRERTLLQERALEAARVKSEFLANMSHELRTPMNAVIGSAEVLSRTNLNSEQSRFVEIITSAGHSLLEIIDDILLLSKIEAGKHQRDTLEFDLRTLLDDCTRIFEAKIREKKIGLRTEIAYEADTTFIGDPQSIRQILTNFVSNAIKFTQQGAVTLRVSADEITEDAVGLRFDVMDTGLGISEDQISRLFQPFSQADGSITRRFGGTGLGLAISKKLSALMGGTVSVESKLGVGSTFSLRLRLRKGSKIKQPVTASTEQKRRLARINEFASALPLDANKCVLLVEDNVVNQEVAKYELRALGFDCVVCSNGEEAVKILSTHRFPLVLMDCQMPIMDGYEATRLIREREKLGKSVEHTPIIAMTANAMEGDAEKCLAAGMDAYISKPVTVETLKSVIEQWFLIAMDREDALLKPLTETFGEEGARKLLGMFFQQAPEFVQRMEAAIDRDDAAELERAAHSLRGSAAALGFTDLAEITKDIELNSGDLIIATNNVAQLRSELERLNSELESVVEPAAEVAQTHRIVVVEDNELTRQAIVSILSQIPDFSVIADYDNGELAIQAISEKQPEAVVFDIDLPGISGIEAVMRLKSTLPQMKAVMLTSHDSDGEIFRAFEAGADGYILKHAFNKSRLELAIRTVLNGGCWLDPALAKRVLQISQDAKRTSPPDLRVLSAEDEIVLTRIADTETATCDGDVCSIDSAFLNRLRRLK